MNLSLTDIEKELRELSNVNSTAWIQMYKLLTIVKSEKLYKEK